MVRFTERKLEPKMTFEELTNLAKEKVSPRELTPNCYVASVACALETEDGHVYTGVSIDSSSSLGFCAEHGAIADMIQHNESRVVRCVAVHYSGKIYAPCGRCRQFFYNINPDNLANQILLLLTTTRRIYIVASTLNQNKVPGTAEHYFHLFINHAASNNHGQISPAFLC